MIKTPIWITNFKNYEESTGQNAVNLAKIHEKVAKETGASIAVAVAPLDLYRVASQVSIPVFCQHVDPVDYGKSTGYILPQGIKKAGGIGTIINHSEKRIERQILRDSEAFAQKVGLVRVVCAESPEEVGDLAELSPDFLAFEPPELIGSSTKSVSSEEPQSIARSVELSRGIPILVGAGINSLEDIKIALRLGAKGFLVATAIVKARDPEKALREFVKAFSNQ